MKALTIAALGAAALTVAGCNKKEDTTANAGAGSQVTAPASDVAAATTPASPAQTFANTAAASDMFEIETSKLAASKGASSKIKTFATQMVKAHTDSTTKLKIAAAAASPTITPAGTLTAAQQATIAELATKSGSNFDRAYAEVQVAAHQTTLDALKSYSASGDVASLKAFATELVPIVTAHLNMAKSL